MEDVNRADKSGMLFKPHSDAFFGLAMENISKPGKSGMRLKTHSDACCG